MTDDELLEAMLAHPILINRPSVETPLGTRLCRPSEAVLDILPGKQKGAFAKEDGEQVIDERGKRHKQRSGENATGWPGFATATPLPSSFLRPHPISGAALQTKGT